ncbi:MAG: basic amino acid ABC transporter substrate-binding protein [Ignisphaera sp.]|uniref:Basic amino acid ABC transporter substrate-binding protein n=1 Tax=Ignisphaera aggregans TaxID=334771 RepID=A0A7J3N002_9CREN
MRAWIYILVVAVVVVSVMAIYLAYSYFLSLSPKPKILRIGTSPDFPPFEYIDEKTNEVVGIDIDLIKAVANRLGYSVEIVSMDFDGLIPALEQGHVDIVISGMTITEEREKRVDFSIPYWEADQAIIVFRGSSYRPQSLEDLDNYIVGVQSGTTAAELLDNLVKQGYRIEIKRYTSYTLAVQDLINGRVDAVVVDSPVARALEKRYSIEISCVIPTNERYGIAVREGNRELLDQINKVLNDILNSNEWDQIIAKYLG